MCPWSGREVERQSCLLPTSSTLRAPVVGSQEWQRLHSLLRASLLRACRPSTCSVPLHLPVNVDESAARPTPLVERRGADAAPVCLQRRIRFDYATDREQAPQARIPGGCFRLAGVSVANCSLTLCLAVQCHCRRSVYTPKMLKNGASSRRGLQRAMRRFDRGVHSPREGHSSGSGGDTPTLKDTRAACRVCMLSGDWPATRTRLLRPDQHPHLDTLFHGR